MLRDGDFEILMPALRPIPGVVLEKQPKLITADRRIGSPVLDGLRNVWQANRDATAGWAVRLFRPDGWIEAGRVKLDRMRAIGERHGLTPLQLSCAWDLAHGLHPAHHENHRARPQPLTSPR